MEQYLERLRRFTFDTFGPGRRTEGHIAHIVKELDEVRAEPDSPNEWVDVAMLALAAALRTGASPSEVAARAEAKLAIVEQRVWPDWRTADPDKPIEHVR